MEKRGEKKKGLYEIKKRPKVVQLPVAAATFASQVSALTQLWPPFSARQADQIEARAEHADIHLKAAGANIVQVSPTQPLRDNTVI